MSIIKYDQHLKTYARELRNKQTPAEQTLWQFLRKKQVLNLRFSRQKPLGPYIVDFYAKDANLIVEIDGAQHYDESHQLYDKRRDDYLRSLGLSILRFNNIEVTRCIESVLHIIECKIRGESYKSQHGEYIVPW